ncbi:MAG: aldose 1-epimerase [Lachnospiraceae bacterium]|nr:aldose 1-epimerase [Lachnospiraceae bacterium]
MAELNNISLEGYDCVEMIAGDYKAILAPGIGNNIIRLRNEAENIDVFRHDEEHPYTTVLNNPETYGYPFLYLPNRLDEGRLRTSDAVYHLPINEEGPFYNAIHGFLHKRAYKVIKSNVIDDDTVTVVSEFKYDENDEFYQYFPVAFTVRMTFTLSAKDGLLQNVEMRNDSKVMLPVGFCSHTAFQVPFIDGTDPKDYFLSVPVTERWEINNRCLPTEKVRDLTEYDMRYNEGTMPVTRGLDNDLYSAGMNSLNGQEFYGSYAVHKPTNKKVCYEVSQLYRFWCVWNDRGENGYFCPEPCTWIINAPNLDTPKNRTGYWEIKPDEVYECWQHITIQ